MRAIIPFRPLRGVTLGSIIGAAGAKDSAMRPFAKTLEEHNRNVAKLRGEQRGG